MEATTYSQRSKNGNDQPREEPLAHAYVLVIPSIEGPVLESLQKLLAALATHDPVVLPLGAKKPTLEIVDSWLEHTAAAEYLGVARSTLYRYAEHHDIESRKFGGRLEYRLSSLDEFKAHHVRPVRRSLHESGIIPSAPRSGK